MALIPQFIGAQDDAVALLEATALPCVASTTANVLAVQITSQLIDVLPHEANDRTWRTLLASRQLTSGLGAYYNSINNLGVSRILHSRLPLCVSLGPSSIGTLHHRSFDQRRDGSN